VIDAKQKSEVELIQDPDRRAAEHVLLIGKMVKVNEQAQEIRAAADLPRE
jgi:heterodisulfide reductase subunit C